MTLKDVAEKAGVSVSTVSRVIASSNEKCASEEVKKRIWKAVQETGYRPNQSAQALRKGAPGQNERAASICCLFARSKDFASDRYFEELSGYVKQEIMRRATGWASSLPSTTLRKWPRETTARESGTALL